MVVIGIELHFRSYFFTPFILLVHNDIDLMKEWRDDMKDMLMWAGLSAHCTILLYQDPNVEHYEDFMSDIVTVMDNFELPNLFHSDDKTKIMNAMQLVAKNSVRISSIIIFKN